MVPKTCRFLLSESGEYSLSATLMNAPRLPRAEGVFALSVDQLVRAQRTASSRAYSYTLRCRRRLASGLHTLQASAPPRVGSAGPPVMDVQPSGGLAALPTDARNLVRRNRDKTGR
jgi:hypothetical protein